LPAENQQVNPSFNISAVNTSIEKPVLLVQAGKQGISFIQLDNESNTFIALQVYHFAKQLSNSDIAASINEVLSAENLAQQQFKKIFVTWCFDEGILVPNKFFDAAQAKQMLDLVYGDASTAVVQHDIVTAQNLRTVYRVPVEVKNIFNTWFPFAIQNHQHSLLINVDTATTDLLYCNFYPAHVTVLLKKNGQLQLVQNFEFSTPQDAVYHLLNVCQAFEMDKDALTLSLAGMIDADSNLYSELHKYFLNINLAALPGNFNYSEAIQEQPAQYFSHLFATASCVL